MAHHNTSYHKRHETAAIDNGDDDDGDDDDGHDHHDHGDKTMMMMLKTRTNDDDDEDDDDDDDDADGDGERGGDGDDDEEILPKSRQVPKTVRNGPREHVDASSRKPYFHASSGPSGDAREQRGFSKVRVFVQPLRSEQSVASADETKNSATNPFGARVHLWRYFFQKTTSEATDQKRKMGQTDARFA